MSTQPSEAGRLRLWDRMSYAIGSMGFCIMFMTVSGYLLYTYTDVFYLNPVTAANIFLFTRFWDAVNDPIMGVIVDKHLFVKRGWGVYRPWLLLSIPCLIVTFTLCFTMPSFIRTETGKVLWAVVFYVLYTMAQTLGQVPFGSMSNALTPSTQERGLLGSYRNFGENIASWLVSILIMGLVGFFGNNGADPARGYAGSALTLGIMGGICLLICFLNTKERVNASEMATGQKVGLGDSFRMLFRNRPTLVMILALFVAAVVINFRFAFIMYYCNVYLAGIENTVTIINSVQTAVAIISFWVVNFMFKHMEKKTMLLTCAALFVLDGVIFLVAQRTMPLIILGSVIFGFCMALSFSTVWGTVPDGVEYGTWRSRITAPAFVFAMVTFAQKCGIGIASWLAGISLDMIGYEAGAAVAESTAMGVYWWNGLILVIGGAIFGLDCLPYNLNRKRYAEITQELSRRGNA